MFREKHLNNLSIRRKMQPIFLAKPRHYGRLFCNSRNKRSRFARIFIREDGASLLQTMEKRRHCTLRALMRTAARARVFRWETPAGPESATWAPRSRETDNIVSLRSAFYSRWQHGLITHAVHRRRISIRPHRAARAIDPASRMGSSRRGESSHARENAPLF